MTGASRGHGAIVGHARSLGHSSLLKAARDVKPAWAPAASVDRAPEGASLEQAATLPMNGLTVRLALDLLALKQGDTLAVTGAAGAVGGYAVELGVADGLRVIAVAAASDEPLLKTLGADAVVARGPHAAEGIRDIIPAGVHGLVDAAAIGAPILPAIRD